MINSILKIIQGWVNIKGATDGTNIGNVSDSLKTNVTNTINANIPSGTNVNNFPAVQPVSNSSLSSIDTKTPALGQTTMASSSPVAIASDQTKIPVEGNVAAAASDSGNPVKVGGVYNSTLPTYTNGQRGDIQLDAKGRQIMSLAYGTKDVSTAALSANATYTSTVFDSINGQTFLNVSAFSVTDINIFIDESSDGINFVTINASFIVANGYNSFSHSIASRYARVRFKNGTVANAGGITNLYLASSLDAVGTNDEITLADKFGSPIGADKIYGLRVKTPNDVDTFGAGVSHSRISQLNANFSQPLANNDVTSTVTASGTVTQANGSVTIATGTTATSSASLATNTVLSYSPGREAYAVFTAAFTTPTSAASSQRIGLYNTANGFFIGYNGLNFSIGYRQNSSDVFTNQTSFNEDTLQGNINSRFTRQGVPEAINPALKNIFRVRFGWLGVAPIKFEILSPDGDWVLFHTIRYPNTAVPPHIYSTALPITAEAIKTASDATNLQISSSSWDAGIVDASGVDLSYNSTISAVNGAATSLTSGKNTISFNVTGTWVGTLVIEGHNGDLSWTQINGYTSFGSALNSLTSNQFFYVNSAAFTQVRIRASAWTSGTATVQSNATISSLFTFNAPAASATYSATSAIAFSAANNATDIFGIQGSASKTVRILRMTFHATQTTAGTINLLVIKRSTATTGGTSATATNVAHDSNDAAGTATVLNWTVNPTTLGTSVGNVRAGRVFVPAPASVTTTQPYVYDFTQLPEKGIILRGTGQGLYFNLNATTVTGNLITCWCEWTEE